MPNTNNEAGTYDEFVMQMIRDKGLAEADQQQGGRIRESLILQVDEEVQKSIIDALSEEQAQALENLLDADAADEEIAKFFAGTGIDFAKAASEAMQRFRENYFGNNTNMTVNNTNNSAVAAGQPVQGVVSEVPGASDVEGRAVKEEA